MFVGGGIPPRRLLVVEKLKGQHGAIRKQLRKSRDKLGDKAHPLLGPSLEQEKFFSNTIGPLVDRFLMCLVLNHSWYLKLASNSKHTIRFFAVLTLRVAAAMQVSDSSGGEESGKDAAGASSAAIDLCQSQSQDRDDSSDAEGEDVEAVGSASAAIDLCQSQSQDRDDY